MADDLRGGRGYPPRENPNEQKYPPQPEHDDRRAYSPPAGASSTMTLPSAHYPAVAGGYPSEPRYPDPRYSSGPRHPSDQRYSDSRTWPEEPPTNHNGYSAPPAPRTEPLPPIQYPEDRPRFEPTRPPPPPGYDERRSHNDHRMPYEERGRYGDRYPEPYYPPPPAAGGPYGPPQDPYYRYPPPGQPYPAYNDYARAGHNAPPPTAPQQQQAAPRQRTSIACRYCRKRKIRCSGYANTTNGKCANCDKLRIDCIFQPVSSNSTTAFVPVSAVPGGVPPGTQLYGAYGQPISGPGQPPQAPQQPGQQQRSYPPGPASDYASSLHSPVSQYNPSYDDRDRDTSRRRPRPSDDEPVMRLPPPNYPPDEDPRRRSPASAQSNGTPPTLYDQYHSAGSYEHDRTRTPQRNSPGGPPPTAAPPSQTQPPSQPFGTRNPMSLTHLIRPESEIRAPSRDIDMSMKSKLDSRRS